MACSPYPFLCCPAYEKGPVDVVLNSLKSSQNSHGMKCRKLNEKKEKLFFREILN